jgi:hypothetical protein
VAAVLGVLPAQIDCGDCNGDGGITIMDALLAAQHAVALIELDADPYRQCDVDRSTVITALDAMMIARAAAGMPATLNCAPRPDPWVLETPLHSPGARNGHAMAFDSARGQVVLFHDDETWLWDGADWQQAIPALYPQSRTSGHAMAFDEARGVVVLFGGDRVGTTPGPWLWDGANWSAASPAVSPPAHAGTALAYDSSRHVVVMFGGDLLGGVHDNSTWEWDGTNWTQRLPAVSPAPRAGHALAYDPINSQVVLFGGSLDYQVLSDETWLWDGNSWALCGPQRKPCARRRHAMAFDPTVAKIILIGGTWLPPPSLPISDRLNDTWAWDCGSWVRLHPATSPPPRYGHALVHDASRGEIVLFGGSTELAAAVNETWTQ